MRLIHWDCLEEMKKFNDNYIDLTVTSPPYDNLRTYTWSLEWWEHIWKPIIEELYRITKDWWVVVWVVWDATIKWSETGTSFKQALYFKECWFNLHDTMIWEKTTPVPQFKTKRYTQSFEYMFILSKWKPNICNYLETKCKTAWMKKNRNNKWAFSMNSADKPRNEITITKDKKILNNVRKYPVWWKKDLWHPAVFPEQLAEDHILSRSNEWDIIFDPFAWSWTVWKMAKLNNRKYILIEKVEEYFNIINERLTF